MNARGSTVKAPCQGPTGEQGETREDDRKEEEGGEEEEREEYVKLEIGGCECVEFEIYERALHLLNNEFAPLKNAMLGLSTAEVRTMCGDQSNQRCWHCSRVWRLPSALCYASGALLPPFSHRPPFLPRAGACQRCSGAQLQTAAGLQTLPKCTSPRRHLGYEHSQRPSLLPAAQHTQQQQQQPGQK